jgi:hypothetical protein
MTVCRTLAEIEAAAFAHAQAYPPLTQEQANQVAAILAPYLPGLSAAGKCSNRTGPYEPQATTIVP